MINIEELGGNCPVQAEGTIDGKRFYFRARGKHWTMEIHPTAEGDYLSWPEDRAEWRYKEDWGSEEYGAGWMPEEEARELIAKAAELYRSQGKAPEASPEG